MIYIMCSNYNYWQNYSSFIMNFCILNLLSNKYGSNYSTHFVIKILQQVVSNVSHNWYVVTIMLTIQQSKFVTSF